MNHVFKTHRIELEDPDGSGPYEIDVMVEWKLISKAIPAKLYGSNAGPAEPADWDVQSIELK